MRSMHRKLAVLCGCVCISLISAACGAIDTAIDTATNAFSETSHNTTEPPNVTTHVIRVLDGDTIAVTPVANSLTANDSQRRVPEHIVRILGIDAPEMNAGTDPEKIAKGPECGAQAATHNLQSLLQPGVQVTLQYDALTQRTDTYGRSLAYVILSDGNDVGLNQIEAGFAEAWHPAKTIAPTKFAQYLVANNKAKKQRHGNYNQCSTVGR